MHKSKYRSLKVYRIDPEFTVDKHKDTEDNHKNRQSLPRWKCKRERERFSFHPQW